MPPKRKRSKVDDVQKVEGTTAKQLKLEKTEQLEDSERQYFLMKAEPESRIEKGKDVKFSIDDLKKVESEPWDGVRNGEASKTMRERMKVGDLAFFYHSNTKSPGIAGIAEIVREGYPDSSAWDPAHPYYDPKTNKERPKWFRVDVKYVRHMSRFISLQELRKCDLDKLKNMQLLRRPQLSVQRLTKDEWDCILELEKVQYDDGTDESKPIRETNGDHDEAVKAEIRTTHGGSP